MQLRSRRSSLPTGAGLIVKKPMSDTRFASDWSRIHGLSLEVANLTLANKASAAERARRRLLAALSAMNARHGPLPSILATKAEYIKAPKAKKSLLLRAYRNAVIRHDPKNKTLIASSLAEFYVDEQIDHRRARVWLDRLEQALREFSDPTERRQLRRLRRALADQMT